MNKSKVMNTRTLVYAGFLTAISIVLTRFLAIMVPLAGLPTLRISFGEIPLMISGLLFGPVVGGISGLAADLIGVMVNLQGPSIHPGFTLSSILWGVIPGILGIYFKTKVKGGNPFSLGNITIIVSACILFISLGLNTYWLSNLFGKGFMVLLPGRALSALVNIPIQSFITTTLIKHLRGMVTV
ncbi:folate family ECF transporter S component [Tissierella praeacuta]|uniref:folate family ECF transporter S component n=1 Tax=Tissierella praeacuta TaxID=43131 RepID=UPI0010D55CD6|nr:folate family ECF transporter S component [Tissierella praeacuta]TCU70720.1 ECF transporter S component (folate family) [Tissierella praeacuta]